MFFTLSYPLKRFFLPIYPHKRCRLSSAAPVAVEVNLSDSVTPVTAGQMRPVHHPILSQMSRFFHEAPAIEQSQFLKLGQNLLRKNELRPKILSF